MNNAMKDEKLSHNNWLKNAHPRQQIKDKIIRQFVFCKFCNLESKVF